MLLHSWQSVEDREKLQARDQNKSSKDALLLASRRYLRALGGQRSPPDLTQAHPVNSLAHDLEPLFASSSGQVQMEMDAICPLQPRGVEAQAGAQAAWV